MNSETDSSGCSVKNRNEDGAAEWWVRQKHCQTVYDECREKNKNTTQSICCSKIKTNHLPHLGVEKQRALLKAARPY